MNDERRKRIDAIKPVTEDEIAAGRKRLGLEPIPMTTRTIKLDIESFAALVRLVEHLGARVVALEKQAAPAGFELDEVRFRPKGTDASVSLGRKG
jgi:hypothetical protein